MSDGVVFDEEGAVKNGAVPPGSSPVTATASSPVAAALIRARVVPNERVARVVILSLAALAVGGAFVSVRFATPNQGVAGVSYGDLSAAERAEIPEAERTYLEHLEQTRREIKMLQ